MPQPDKPAPERDAICFTSGPAGAFFSAGVIHAHLAADRPAPAVVAGISTGSISAAAMQRAYRSYFSRRDRTNPGRTEAGRWQWLRHYISHLIDRPASVFWNSLPNPTDFFAEHNAPSLHDPSLAEPLTVEEMHANRQKYLLTNLGNWFAQLPIKFSTMMTAVVRYVRYKERYSGDAWTRAFNFYRSVLILSFQMIWHIISHPVWVREGILDNTACAPRPVLGWEVYTAAWIIPLLPVGAILLFVLGLLFLDARDVTFWGIVLYALGYPVLCWAMIHVFRRRVLVGLRRSLLSPMLANVGFRRSLLHNFHLRLRIMEVLQDPNAIEKVNEDPMPILLVTAPLQTFYEGKRPVRSRQLWPHPGGDVKLVDAILASTASPGVWPPHVVAKPPGEVAFSERWDPLQSDDPQPADDADRLDLVDGGAVRRNPLPALLEFLQRRPDVVAQIERKSPGDQWSKDPPASIHVVYSVPLHGPAGDGRMRDDAANIVDVPFAARDLAARRDTYMEVEQLNCISRLEIEVQTAGENTSPQVTVAFADGIAPPANPILSSDFGNPLSPDSDAALTKIAEGCRRTLEQLYRPAILDFHPQPADVPCHAFLRSIAPERPWNGSAPLSPGLPEVCDHCTQKLRRLPKAKGDEPKKSLLQIFPQNLTVRRDGVAQPRIVFVWSGGVFRGSFHIGMIGALLQMNIQPDLIAGASVGTLMGAAIASMFASPPDERGKRLGKLVNIFKDVDQSVALTRTLKEATRDLGIRGRQIRLSPAMIRKVVLSGTQGDPGYAATGAPPALIDAISSFLSIPLEETRQIAGLFIAGLVADAAHSMLKSIKKHTLARLSIETCVLGASLLQGAARTLIEHPNVDLSECQPFQKQGIAFLATTTNLGAQDRVVLWDDPSGFDKPYDFLYAALSSSAFPAVFSPRRASEVFPGWGRHDVRYSDGGMFDNLPFFPAINALHLAQRDESQNFANNPAEMVHYIKDRYENPDLFLAGALNVNPEKFHNHDGPFTYFNQISARAVSLGNNSKIHSFINAAEVGHRQLGKLNNAFQNGAKPAFRDPDFIRTYVNAAVLPVFPADTDHLNPTFAFCKSTGMESERLERSIADGCYQTFKAFSEPSTSEAVAQSLSRLRAVGRIPEVTPRPRPPKPPKKDDLTCPFFLHKGATFQCCFAGMDKTDIRRICDKDPMHKEKDPLHK